MPNISKLILLVAFSVSLVVSIGAFYAFGAADKSSWGILAASLAVMASTIAAWTAQQVLDLQRNAQRPYPYPSIDVTSRYELMQLRVTNSGGTPAHDITLGWDEPLLKPDGEQVRFTKQQGVPEIPVLLPGESVAVLVGGCTELYEKYKDMNCSGTVMFTDASGKARRHRFHLSAEKYRSGLTYDTEELKTHYQLQQIPKELKKICDEMKKVLRGKA